MEDCELWHFDKTLRFVLEPSVHAARARDEAWPFKSYEIRCS